MNKYVLPLVLLALICGCKKKSIYVNPAEKLTDAVRIGSKDVDDVLNMEYIDNDELVSFNFRNNSFKWFRRTSGITFNKYADKKFLPQVSFHSFNKLGANTFLLIDYDNTHYILDSNLNYKVYRSTSAKAALANRYINSGLKYHPVLIDSEKLISTYYYTRVEDYDRYFSEPVISEYALKDSFLTETDRYITKPSGLIRFQLPFPRYCYNKDKMLLIYPCYDTLYIYDRKGKTLDKVAINNRDYVMPQLWDYKKLFSEDYNSYNTKYALNNFRYNSIYYNPLTQHYLLFYNTPVSKDETTQDLKLLVMDQSFNTVCCYEFTNTTYFDTENFLMMPGKGIGMPVFSYKNSSNENYTLYHIYNF